jgi:hypothetical protein
MRPLIFSILVFSFCICKQVSAQDERKLTMLEGGIIVVKPLGAFGDNINKEAMFGLDFRFLRQFKTQLPIFWGLHYQWAPYASASSTITEQLDNALIDFDYKTYANMQGIYSIVRFYAPFSYWKIEPYLEGALGGKWMFSGTTKTIVDGDESSDFSIEKSNLTLSYGASLGTSIVLSKDFYLDLRASYLTGLQSKYLIKNGESIINTSADAFETKRGLTNVLIYNIGITGVIE